MLTKATATFWHTRSKNAIVAFSLVMNVIIFFLKRKASFGFGDMLLITVPTHGVEPQFAEQVRCPTFRRGGSLHPRLESNQGEGVWSAFDRHGHGDIYIFVGLPIILLP